MPSDIDSLAEDIINIELDYVTGSAASWDEATAQRASLKSTVSGYLATNLGQMNVLINSQFGVDEHSNFCPALKLEEKAILTQLYLKDYYTKESRKTTLGISSSFSSSTGGSSTEGGEWTSIQEGDTVVIKGNERLRPGQKVKPIPTNKEIEGE